MDAYLPALRTVRRGLQLCSLLLRLVALAALSLCALVALGSSGLLQPAPALLVRAQYGLTPVAGILCAAFALPLFVPLLYIYRPDPLLAEQAAAAGLAERLRAGEFAGPDAARSARLELRRLFAAPRRWVYPETCPATLYRQFQPAGLLLTLLLLTMALLPILLRLQLGLLGGLPLLLSVILPLFVQPLADGCTLEHYLRRRLLTLQPDARAWPEVADDYALQRQFNLAEKLAGRLGGSFESALHLALALLLAAPALLLAYLRGLWWPLAAAALVHALATLAYRRWLARLGRQLTADLDASDLALRLAGDELGRNERETARLKRQADLLRVVSRIPGSGSSIAVNAAVLGSDPLAYLYPERRPYSVGLFLTLMFGLLGAGIAATAAVAINQPSGVRPPVLLMLGPIYLSIALIILLGAFFQAPRSLASRAFFSYLRRVAGRRNQL